VQERGRDLRIGDFVRDEIASIIQRQLRDPRVGMVMVNDVNVSRDLSWADVYITSIDAVTPEERSELISVLNKASGYFRTELAKRHTMRTTPKPRFHYDESVERGPRLEALIDSALDADSGAVEGSQPADGSQPAEGSQPADGSEEDNRG
jgi:ribosome-binding factor A